MTDEERAAIAAICVAHADRAPHVLATLRRPEWDSLELVRAREAFVKTYRNAVAAIVRELIADDVAELVAVVKLCGRAMREFAPDLLPALVVHHRREVAIAAIEAVSESGARDAVSALLAIVERGDETSAAAIRALTVMDHAPVVPLAIARWDADDVALCEAIVIACEWFGSADELLAIAARHPVLRVRARAALAVRSPGVVAAELPALEAVLQAGRDDATLLVYADVLQREGDPRGELIALGEADPARTLELAMQWIGKRKLGGYAWNPRRIRDGLLDEYRGCADDLYVEDLLRSAAGRYLRGATIDLASHRAEHMIAALAMRPRPWLRRLSLRGAARSSLDALFAALPNLEELELVRGVTIAHPVARIVEPPAPWSEPDGSWLAIDGKRRFRTDFLHRVAQQAEWLSDAAAATWREVFAVGMRESVAIAGVRRALAELDDSGFELPRDDAPVEVDRFALDLY